MLDRSKKVEYTNQITDYLVALNRLRGLNHAEKSKGELSEGQLAEKAKYTASLERLTKELKLAGVLGEFGMLTPEAEEIGLKL